MKKKLSLLLPLLLLASCSSKGPKVTEPAKDIESVNTETTSEKEENLETPLITDPLPTEESTEKIEEIETEPKDEDESDVLRVYHTVQIRTTSSL